MTEAEELELLQLEKEQASAQAPAMSPEEQVQRTAKAVGRGVYQGVTHFGRPSDTEASMVGADGQAKAPLESTAEKVGRYGGGAIDAILAATIASKIGVPGLIKMIGYGKAVQALGTDVVGGAIHGLVRGAVQDKSASGAANAAGQDAAAFGVAGSVFRGIGAGVKKLAGLPGDVMDANLNPPQKMADKMYESGEPKLGKQVLNDPNYAGLYSQDAMANKAKATLAIRESQIENALNERNQMARTPNNQEPFQSLDFNPMTQRTEVPKLDYSPSGSQAIEQPPMSSGPGIRLREGEQLGPQTRFNPYKYYPKQGSIKVEHFEKGPLGEDILVGSETDPLGFRHSGGRGATTEQGLPQPMGEYEKGPLGEPIRTAPEKVPASGQTTTQRGFGETVRSNPTPERSWAGGRPPEANVVDITKIITPQQKESILRPLVENYEKFLGPQHPKTVALRTLLENDALPYKEANAARRVLDDEVLNEYDRPQSDVAVRTEGIENMSNGLRGSVANGAPEVASLLKDQQRALRLRASLRPQVSKTSIGSSPRGTFWRGVVANPATTAAARTGNYLINAEHPVATPLSEAIAKVLASQSAEKKAKTGAW